MNQSCVYDKACKKCSEAEIYLLNMYQLIALYNTDLNRFEGQLAGVLFLEVKGYP